MFIITMEVTLIPESISPRDLGLALAGVPVPTVPSTCTSADLARLLGCSERWVASLKAAGKLPLLADNRIDLHTLMRRGVDAIGAKHGAGGSLSAVLVFETALGLAARITAIQAVQAAPPETRQAVVEAAIAGIAAAANVLGIDLSEGDLHELRSSAAE